MAIYSNSGCYKHFGKESHFSTQYSYGGNIEGEDGKKVCIEITQFVIFLPVNALS